MDTFNIQVSLLHIYLDDYKCFEKRCFFVYLQDTCYNYMVHWYLPKYILDTFYIGGEGV